MKVLDLLLLHNIAGDGHGINNIRAGYRSGRLGCKPENLQQATAWHSALNLECELEFNCPCVHTYFQYYKARVSY